MQEKKTELPKFQKLMMPIPNSPVINKEAAVAMAQTIDELSSQPEVEVYYEPNNERDFFVTNVDNSITRVAYSPTINGVRFIIPAGERVKVPKSIYEALIHSEEMVREAQRPMPFQSIGQLL